MDGVGEIADMDEETPESSTGPATASDRIEDALEPVAGFMHAQILYAGVQLDLFEAVGDDPRSAGAIADDLELQTAYAYRLLRALASFGYTDETGDRRFSLTATGELFQADHPQSLRDGVLTWLSPEFSASWRHLPDIVEEGEPSGFVREFGCNSFDYAEANPEFAAAFNGSQTIQSRLSTPQVLDALAGYDFTQVSHVCDVGGGQGHTLCHLLATYPRLDGTIVDLPNVVEDDSGHWAPKLGVDDRCRYIAGDMFESVPTADAYILKFILHDWPDEECVEILSTIHEAAPADGRLFIIERLLPGPGTPHPSKRADIEMMVINDSRERTQAEYETLLNQAGWEFETQWEPDEGAVSGIEARKP